MANPFDQFDSNSGPITLGQPDPYKAASEARANSAEARAKRAEDRADRAENRADAIANKPPSGFMWAADGKSLLPIPGGPEDPSAPTGGPDKKRRQVLDNDLLLTNIQRARELVEQSGTTGFAAALSRLPATDARRLSNIFDTIRANLTFDRLQQMRDESKTGGAVGNASDADMKLLGATAGSLDQYQSSADLLTVLDDVENKYRGFHAMLDGKDPNDEAVRREYHFRGVPGAAGNGPGGGQDRSSPLLGGGETDGVTLMRKGQRFATENDKRLHTLIQTMLDNGASVEEANATAEGLGYTSPDGRPIFDAKEWAAAQRYNATVRDGQPRATVTTPETGVSDPTLLNSAMSSPFGALAGGYLNGVTMGGFDEAAGAVDSLFTGRPLDEAVAEADLKKGLIAAEHPKTNFAGNLLGGATSFVGGNILASKLLPGAVAKLGKFAPAVGDTLYGGAFGALEDNDNRLGGGALGAVTGVGGGMLGRTAGRGLGAVARTDTAQGAMNAVRGIMGKPLLSAPLRPGAADRATLGAVNKGGVDDITAQLQEAQTLGIPMTLADTHPELRSLAGASVRRSPTASLHAENTLIPRSRGQINRLGQYVERDLGPTANLVETSKGLSAKAKQDAKPLYEAAFSSPGASSVNVNGMLQTPAGQAALRRAYDVMRNRQMDPTSLGFDLNDAGEVVLNRVPSFQALDIVKRELDDAISSAPFDPVTRQQTFTPAQRDAIQLRNELVSEMDRVNPDYKAARAAYAGPASEREALRMGRQSVNQNPDVVASNFGGLTPPRQKQFKLGYRSGMMENAERVRLAGNPLEATLGSPAQQETVGALFPEGAPNLIRSYNLERNLANTTNDILGNSKTAQRGLADQEFGVGDLASTALDVGVNIATGQVPTGLVLKQGAGQAIKDWWKLGVGNKARQKAEELAPILINPEPLANIDTLTRLTREAEAFNQFLAGQRRRLSRPAGMLGSVAASQGQY